MGSFGDLPVPMVQHIFSQQIPKCLNGYIAQNAKRIGTVDDFISVLFDILTRVFVGEIGSITTE